MTTPREQRANSPSAAPATSPAGSPAPDAGVPGPDAGPRGPIRLHRRALWTAVRRSVREFNEDNAWDWAAALTYYGVLSIFPGLLVLVSLIGVVGTSSIQPASAENTSSPWSGPEPVRNSHRAPLR